MQDFLNLTHLHSNNIKIESKNTQPSQVTIQAHTTDDDWTEFTKRRLPTLTNSIARGEKSHA